MKQFTLRKHTNHKEIKFKAFSYSVSKGERLLEFYLEKDGKIATKIFPIYLWYLWDVEDVE